MIEPPLGVRGAFSRQNGPSRDCEVSVLPWSPLLSRQTSEETPSEPAISTGSAWVAVVEWGDARAAPGGARHQHRLVVGVGGELAHLVQDRGRLAELGLGQ